MLRCVAQNLKMNHLKLNSDIEEHLTDFLKLRDRFEQIEKGKEDFSSVITNLTEEISSLKLSEQNLLKQLRSYTNSNDEQNKINFLYGKLKEKYNELDRKYNKLEKENLFIQQNHCLELLELEEKFMVEKDLIVQKHLQQTRVLQNEISEKSITLKKKDKEVQDERERVQSTCEFRYDEMESYLQSQVRDATYKLQESNDSTNMLRQELLRYKSNEDSQFAVLKEKIKKLENKVRTLEHELEISHQKLSRERQNIEIDEFHIPRNKNLSLITNTLDRSSSYLEMNYINDAKYGSLNKKVKGRSETFTNSHSNTLDKHKSLNKELKGRNETFTDVNCQPDINMNNNSGPPKITSFAPPLLQLNVNRKNTRKRKLYDHRNSGFEYLKDLEENQ